MKMKLKKALLFQKILSKIDFVTGVEISKNSLNITLLPLVCHIKCRTDNEQSFFTTSVSSFHPFS